MLHRAGTLSISLERLEPRRLFAGKPLQIQPFDSPSGPALDITGTAGRDRISIVATDAGLVIANTGGWYAIVPNTYALLRVNAARGDDRLIVDGTVTADTVLYGSNGDDTISGGAGADRVFGGMGRDRVLAGAGDDTIVSIGDSTLDRTTGGDGNDSFWTDALDTEIVTDASPEEIASGSLHRVASFYAGDTLVASDTNGVLDANATSISRDLAGQDLPDPALSSSSFSYQRFAGLPLFADAGPSPADVRQGAVGDCYLLAPLAALADRDANRVRQTVADMGDGTYAVRFVERGQDVYVRVDADLAVRSAGSVTPAYAGLGVERSLWVAIVEKAYAFFRRGDGRYASLDRGWMSEPFGALGLPSYSVSRPKSAADLLARIDSVASQGGAMTWATGAIPAGVPLVSDHAYSIATLNRDAGGTLVSVTLRNPWGTDGGGNVDSANDGYVTLAGEQLFAVFSAIVYALP